MRIHSPAEGVFYEKLSPHISAVDDLGGEGSGEPSAKRIKVQQAEEEEDKKAEDGEVTQENGERNEDAEKEKVDGEEEKEDDEEEKENDNETVKNGAKENGGKTEADPNKMKSGEWKSVFLTVQNLCLVNCVVDRDLLLQDPAQS